MADPTDAALVAAARDGDKTSFALLLERHRPLLVALCQRTLGNRWSAEDAVQEASLQALLGLGHLRHPGRFGPWLAGIGLNVCRRMLRQRRFEMWTAETLSGGRSGPELADSEPGPEELAEVADVARRVREAVAALPAGQRSAVITFYLAGLSYRETAASLGVALPAAKSRLHKARSGLRHELRSLWEEAFAMSDDELIAVRVADVRSGHNEQKPSPFIVLLEEVDGDRRLPIWIGEHEAFALVLSLEVIDLPGRSSTSSCATLSRRRAPDSSRYVLSGWSKARTTPSPCSRRRQGPSRSTPARATR